MSKSAPPARRRLLLLAPVLPVLLGGAYLGFAHSPLVAVSRVRIEGLVGPQAGAIAATVQRVARRQTTLAVDRGALVAALRPFPEVRSVSAEGVFPSELRVRLAIQLPVAVVQAPDGRREAVGAGGALLGAPPGGSPLPTVPVPALASALLRREPVRSYLALLGAAPRPLLAFISSVSQGERGLTVTLKDGLEAYFGTVEGLAAKWRSLVAVLAQGDISGARYIDVREPAHPAVGGSGAAAIQAKSEQELLIATLQRALYGGPSAAPPAGGGTETKSETTVTEGTVRTEAPEAGLEGGGSSSPSGSSSAEAEQQKTAANGEQSVSG